MMVMDAKPLVWPARKKQSASCAPRIERSLGTTTAGNPLLLFSLCQEMTVLSHRKSNLVGAVVCSNGRPGIRDTSNLEKALSPGPSKFSQTHPIVVSHIGTEVTPLSKLAVKKV